MSQTKIEMRDPQDLRPLPAVKAMPRWARNADEFNGFKEDIRANGILHPLLITKDGKVVDGETRRLAAIDLQLTEVACRIVPDDEVQETIVRELCRRRNLTKGQLAYVICPMLESAYHESLRRSLKNLKNPTNHRSPTGLVVENSVGEWCQLLGFSDELLRQARELHKAFDKDPELRAEWEPKILDLDKPVSIGAARAGIGGAGADQSNRKKGVEQAQLEFWDSPFDKLKDAAWAWAKLDENKRGEVLKAWRKTVLKLPADLRAGLKGILEEVE